MHPSTTSLPLRWTCQRCEQPGPTRTSAAPAATVAATSSATEHEIRPRWSTQRTARLTQSALLQTGRPLQVLTGHLRMLLHQKSRNKNHSPTKMPQTSVSPLRIQTPTSTFWKDAIDRLATQRRARITSHTATKEDQEARHRQLLRIHEIKMQQHRAIIDTLFADKKK